MRSDEYRKIKTSSAVWEAIKATHDNLAVFSSYSAPDGDRFGDPSVCKMMTEYGFENCDFPIMGAETTWEKGEDYKRVNWQHEYWLCVGINKED